MEAKEIRQIRESLGLSQEAFAKLLRVSYATVNRWEKNRARLDEETKEQLHVMKTLLNNAKVDKNKVKNLLFSAGLGGTATLGIIGGLVGSPIMGPMAGLLGITAASLAHLFVKEKKEERR